MFGKKNKNIKKLDKDNIPKHVAIIMDGNGRWAKKHKMPRNVGHSMGAKNLEKIVDFAGNMGVKHLTVYAFSTENWKRPKEEVDALMKLLADYLRDFDNVLGSKDARLRVLGNRLELSKEINDLIDECQEKSKHKTGISINIALNYGGRFEICQAVKQIAQNVKNGEIDVSEIDEEMISSKLYTYDIPDPDLIIRPSGEYRLSNFLLWQCAYSEFWFSNVFWPDFSTKKFEEAIIDFQSRNRRFGGI